MKTTLSPVLGLAALLVGVTTDLLGMACCDGAQPAPYLVADINSTDPQGSSPQNLVAVGSTVFFQAYDPTAGYELWKSDGTTTALVADINPGGGDSFPDNLVAVGSTLFFRAYDPT